ncbi:M3 family metallopeptidase [Nocardia terpenica]|uniref:M3 family metallopeptidase n=1 Tax=Nocardia terpenica TaxID=455432 RepID=UPI001894FC87|nr:M3 family metallopeptidase [Nocardia terpenica]MBF6060735.1 M3 family metallopeptidase [Nocardia terpenica]MBF6103995.1 M3 family metallopeptidase [Nocardia terpenica]MBF6111631.1 M3 family metallopeptidase [Nocardia terpenica]MBF6118216.1 M3 family metallopeptidase [Nocardia terpenica]MBF6156159.1 M3 family metallopeptidase [Nocardia terpenica]
MTSNPFFERSTLPYQLPPFAEIGAEHFLPAFERGMGEQLAEVAAITSDREEATFANTVVALERSGVLLTRVSNVFFTIVDADSSDETKAIEAEIAPRLAAHRDAIYLDSELFARIDSLYGRRGELGLDPEQLRLLEQYHVRFVRAGARLGAAEQARLRELNAELAAAATEFGHNLLAATNAAALVVHTAEELAGLEPTAVAAAAENARSLGHEGAWALSLQNVSNQPILAELADRDVRRRVMTASLGRGASAGGRNNRLAVRMAALRAERAALLGYPDHATYTVEDQTAKTPEAVEDLLGRLVAPAVANAQREAAELTAAMRADGDADAELRSWDWLFWSEKVRAERFSIDTEALRPYLELERVLRDGVFFAAEKVYGITVREREDLVGYHPEVRIFEVFDADGSELGLFLADFFARPSKRGGAWMNEIVGQSGLLQTRPVVFNVLNIVKPPEGEPALLTWDNVRTLFHEFGHALHGLFSNVRYPFFAGTEVPRDFVEFPSQVNEMWMVQPEVLANYARHIDTGEPMPSELVERMVAAEKFGTGFHTVESLAAALLDWAWHRVGADALAGADADAFEEQALRKAGLALEAIPPRYRTGYFAHIFAGDYSAGYYSYLWSEVLDADTVDWFTDGTAPIREKGEAFRRELLSRGGSVDPLAAFESFRGRGPEIEPLLVRRGLTD